MTPIDDIINRLYDRNKIRKMKDIVTGKWVPQNKLVTGKPQIIGKEYPGFTGETNPDLFEGEVTDRL